MTARSGGGNSEKDLAARAQALGAAIDRKRAEGDSASLAAHEAESRAGAYGKSSVALGFRLSADFLSAILVGGALGLGADKLTGFSPWGLAVFLLLGFGAGVLNVLRVLGRAPKFSGGRRG